MDSSKGRVMRISVQEFSIGTSLRHFADKLFDLIESMDVKHVIVDFSDTDFVSRSFVQQYLQRKSNVKVDVLEDNLAPVVQRMFELVRANERKAERFDFSTWKVDKLAV